MSQDREEETNRRLMDHSPLRLYTKEFKAKTILVHYWSWWFMKVLWTKSSFLETVHLRWTHYQDKDPSEPNVVFENEEEIIYYGHITASKLDEWSLETGRYKVSTLTEAFQTPWEKWTVLRLPWRRKSYRTPSLSYSSHHIWSVDREHNSVLLLT